MEINIQNVSMTYPSGKRALEGLTLELGSPGLVGLLGPNGAGKSTLLKLLVGALLPDSGAVTVDGCPLEKAQRRLRRRLGYLPQEFGLFDGLTAAQFLDYMAALKGLSDPKAAVRKALCDVGLEKNGKTPIRALSGGQRQRVGIAQALLGDPRLIILDEPTVGLDPEERIRFRTLFSQTAQDRLAVLSTHIIEDVQSVCDRLAVLGGGRLLYFGTPEKLIALAAGHVGVFEERGSERGLTVTARVNTRHGVRCRAVAEVLPDYAEPAEPTLEDAYLYLISGVTAL